MFSRQKPSLKPPNIIARWPVVKHSWRGSYKRVLCITPHEILTQDPQQALRVTNTYSLLPEADIEGVSVGPGDDGFTLVVRGDKRSKFSPVKFSCRHRAALLTDLFQVLSALQSVGRCPAAVSILGSTDQFPGFLWSHSQASWRPVTLRLSAFAIQVVDAQTGVSTWRAEFHTLGSPAFRLLANSTTPMYSSGGAPPAEQPGQPGPVQVVEGVFAVSTRVRGHPKVLASKYRDALLQALNVSASRRLGLTLMVDGAVSGSSVQELMEAVRAAEQQATSTLSEAPLAEWEVSRLKRRHGMPPALAPLAAPHHMARPLVSAPSLEGTCLQELGMAPGANLAPRRLALTPTSLVERRADTYVVSSRRPLAAAVALVRFVEDPKLLGIEWGGGSPPSLYVTSARDAVLAALQDACQAASGCPIPVLPGLTSPGDAVHSSSTSTPSASGGSGNTASGGSASRGQGGRVGGLARDPEVERWCAAELCARLKDAYPALNASRRMMFTGTVEFQEKHVLVDVSAPPVPPRTIPPDSAAPPYAGTNGHSALSPAGMSESQPMSPQTRDGTPSIAGGDPSGQFTAPDLTRTSTTSALGQVSLDRGPPGHGSGLQPSSDLVGPAAAEAIDLVMESVYELCACVPLSGVSQDVAFDGQAAAALAALLPFELQPGLPSVPHLPADEVKQAVMVLQAMQRLVTSHPAADALLSTPGLVGRLWVCYSSGCDDHVATEAGRTMLRLFSPRAARKGAVPWRALRGAAAVAAAALGDEEGDQSSDATADDMSLSQAAKALFFQHSLMHQRVAILLVPLSRPPPAASPLLTATAVELIASVACEPGSRTTEPTLCSSLLTNCAALGRTLFALFQHPAARVHDGVAVLMRAVAEAGPAAAAPLREAALREGALLTHLAVAVAGASAAAAAAGALPGSGVDPHTRASTSLISRIALSRDLVAYWADDYAPAQALLRRVLPPGLVQYLHAPRPSPAPQAPTSATAPQQQQQQQPSQPALQPLSLPAVAAAIGIGGGAVAEQQRSQQPAQQPPQGMQPGAPGAAGAVGAAAGQPALPAQLAGPAAGAALGASTVAGSTQQGLANGNAHAPGTPLSPREAPTASTSAAPARLPPRAPYSLLKGNWGALWDALGKDHFHAGLIWNEQCRVDLRQALEREEAGLRLRRQQVAQQASLANPASAPSWNYAEFSVSYPSLSSHLCIGGVYVRLLLEGADTAAVSKVPAPKDLFTALHHTLLCSDSLLLHPPTGSSTSLSATANDTLSTGSLSSAPASAWPGVMNGSSSSISTNISGVGFASGGVLGTLQGAAREEVQLLCLRAMTEVYHTHAGVIGPVQGLPHLLALLDASPRRPVRHHLLLLVAALLQPRAVQAQAGGQQQLPQAVKPPVGAGPGTATATVAQAQRAARANAYLLVDAGGLELLVDMAACGHEANDPSLPGAGGSNAGGAVHGSLATHTAGSAQRGPNGAVAAPLQLAATAAGATPKEWYVYPQGILTSSSNLVGDQGSTSQQRSADGQASSSEAGAHPALEKQQQEAGSSVLGSPDETGRCGAVTKSQLLGLLRSGAITPGTLVWAEGLPTPQPLASIRELRWLSAQGRGILGGADCARLALTLLLGLARVQPPVDEGGCLLQPLPVVLRVLSSPRCLPHIAQVLLTRDVLLVPLAASLLEVVLGHNEDALARLYLTGAFYFALSYAGSNLAEISRLLALAHTRQAHRGALSVGNDQGLPLAARSYLGHLLPESLLYCLDTYGAEALASALVSDSDTPELLWTHSMRFSRLLPLLSQHLGDFPSRLAQRCGLVWEYLPSPPISYPELTQELWCHRYYLRALCDEARFPAWPLVDHVQLMQALLTAWRAELARTPLSLSEADACAVLGLKPAGPDGAVAEDDVRRAYRALARKFHPDKNPEGRSVFLRVQQAYERLQVGAAGGQGPQAQAILFRRYASALAHYKYAGYTPLLEVLASAMMPPASSPPTAAATPEAMADSSATGSAVNGKDILAPERMQLLQAASELAWRTACCSRLNAAELARSGGLALVGGLLHRLASAGLLPEDVAPTQPPALLATQLVRGLAGLATVEVAQGELAAQGLLLRDILRCCAVSRCHALGEAALIAVGQLAGSPRGQQQLLEAGALAFIVPLLFRYDTTLGPEVTNAFYLPFGPATSSSAAVPGGQATGTLTTGSPGSAQAAAAQGQAAKVAGGVSSTSDKGAAAATAKPLPAAAALSAQDQALGAAALTSLAALDTPAMRSSETAAASYRAILAAQALARLAGLLPAPHQTPDCTPARQALAALLTPALASRLSQPDPRPLLATLNSHIETAQVIWNASMRDEMLAALAPLRDLPPPAPSTSTSAGAADPQQPSQQPQQQQAGALSGWRFSSLQGELQVGGVYVRVYCQRPSVLPADTQGFAKALVRWLYDRYIVSARAPTTATPAGSTPEGGRVSAGGAGGGGGGGSSSSSVVQWALSPSGLSDTLAVLKALELLLEGQPRLLGLLASKSALSPLVAVLRPAAAAAYAATSPASSSKADSSVGKQGGGEQPQVSNGDTTHDASNESTRESTTGGPAAAAASSSPLLQQQQQQQPSQPSSGGDLSAAGSLAEGGLSLLIKVLAHAGCMEALAGDEAPLRLVAHLVQAPPSPGALRRCLHVLRALSGTHACGAVAAGQAGALYLLTVLLHPPGAPWPWPGGVLPGGRADEDEVRGEAAVVLSRLMAGAAHGTAITLMLQRLLPPGLVAAISSAATAPSAAVAALQARSESPELIWEQSMLEQVAGAVADLAHSARAAQEAGTLAWSLPAGFTMQYQRLSSEMVVGGVYLRLFLKHPRHPLRDPLRVGEALLDTLVNLLGGPAPGGAPISSGAAAPGGGGGGASITTTAAGLAGSHAQVADAPALVSAAAVALLSVHPLVGDHLTQLGYITRLLAALAVRRPPAKPAPASNPEDISAQGQSSSAGATEGEGSSAVQPLPQSRPTTSPQLGKAQEEAGAALKVVHALCLAGMPACEALAAYAPAGAGPAASTGGAVGVLGDMRGWGPPSDLLVLEILRRALGPNNRARDVLVAQALACGLVPALLNLLDWKASTAGGGSQSETAAGGEQQGAIVLAPGAASAAAGGAAAEQGQQAGRPAPQELAVLRALAVDVLTALCYPGAAAAQVASLLDGSEVWRAYRGGSHALFLPSGALQGGGTVVGLLAGPEAARLALPGPD